jgi:iron complex outermembrane receptor protein
MVSIVRRILAPTRAALFASAALVFAPSAALAQDTTTDAQDTSAQPEPEASDAGISEIVVTAQRREERLQDVPLSITAISGEDLRNADVRDITRLEQVVPGLRVGRSGPAGRPAIRGTYSEAIQANADPRIGFYIDEIYQSRLQQTTAAFVDLERVEVQKGPQGTLFGRNSLGGNIALTTARPGNEFDGGVALTYGNYDRVRAEGFVNIPIAEGLAFRLSGAADRHDPYFKSVVSKRASLGDLGYQFVRGSLRLAPPGLDDRLEVIVRGSYYNQDDNGYGSFNVTNIGALVDPTLIRQPGQSLTFNGVTYPFPFGFNGGSYATGTLVPFSPVFRDGIADINGADIGLPISGKYRILHDFPAENRIVAKNASAVINFDLTDDVRLRSITGLTDFYFSNINDTDSGPIPFSAFYFVTTAKTITQEVQLQSANSSSPLQYTLGAFYMDDKVDETSGTIFSRTNYSTLTAAANGYPVLFASGGGCGFTFSPLNAPSSCNLSNLGSNDSSTPVKAHTKSYAGYGQVSYTVAEKLTLTAGARYTVDDKDYRQAAQAGGGLTTTVANFVSQQNAAAAAAGQPAPFPNASGYRAVFPFSKDLVNFANFDCGAATAAPFAAAGTNTPIGSVPNFFVTRCGARKFKYWTYRLAADYQITPDNMVYASYSTGVHSGGFGASFTPSTIPQGTFATFDAERVKAFEIGSKNSFLDRRLQVNAAIFYNKYTDNQVQGTQVITTGPNTSVGVATIANVGNTEAPGAELSIIAKPVRRLTLRAAATYLHARNSVAPLGIFSSGLCTISTGPTSPCGAPGSPERIRNQAGLGSGFFPNPQTNPELFVPITNAAGAIIGFDSLFFGKKTRVQNTPDWSANFGASYDIPLSDGATLTPEADVIYSGEYLLSASAPNFVQKAYAKLDVRLTYRTEDGLSLQAYVQNVTDKATLGRITTGTLSAQGTYSDPRTYGVRLGYRF